MLAQAKGVIGNAFKKMSQRAMWRGDRGQSQMLESHGMEGMRSNLLNDTPTYKKEAVGLNQGGINFFKKTAKTNTSNTNKNDRNTNSNTKISGSSAKVGQTQNKGLGSSILNSL